MSLRRRQLPRTVSTRLRATVGGVLPVALVAATAGVGCDGERTAPAPIGTSAPASSQPPAGPSGSGREAPGGDATTTNPHAGVWAGVFTATRGEVTVPEGVPYASWKSDPGGAEGDGAIELTVGPDGAVAGKVTGALGTLAVVGMWDGDALRAGLAPGEDGEMSGVLTGQGGPEGPLEVSLRVSNADASVVRQATSKLTKKR